MEFEKRDHELHGRRRGRNLGVGLALAGLVALLFSYTMVKMGSNAVKPEMSLSDSR